MEQRITLITLGVADLQVSANFYEHILGWKRSPMSSENIVFFELNGIFLSLYERGALARGVLHCIGATTLDEYKKHVEKINDLRNKWVTIVKEPQKVFWGGYSSYFADPDGNLWEVAFNPYL